MQQSSEIFNLQRAKFNVNTENIILMPYAEKFKKKFSFRISQLRKLEVKKKLKNNGQHVYSTGLRTPSL